MVSERERALASGIFNSGATIGVILAPRSSRLSFLNSVGVQPFYSSEPWALPGCSPGSCSAILAAAAPLNRAYVLLVKRPDRAGASL